MAETKPRTDSELDGERLRRARAGDRSAVSELLREEQGRVWSVCRRMLAGRPQEAPDVAQDAMVKLVRELPAFDPGGRASFATWVVTVTTRVCLDHLRRSRVRSVSPLALRATVESAGPETRPYAREVEACIARLPAEQRAVLVLRAYHDLDLDEIATSLKIARGTVKSRLSRARVALRELLEDTE